MNRAAGLALALLAFPVTGQAITWPVTPRGVGGTFGEFRLYSSGAPRYHLGTDVISCGDPVHASIATNGGVVTNVVILSNNNHRVVIDDFYEYDHLADDATFYSMLQSFNDAQTAGTDFVITEGTIIGTSGNTGGVPCHLHFQAGVQGVSNDVFNALAFFSNDDTVNGVLQQVSLRQNGAVVIPDVQDGGAYSQTGTAEFVVLGNDLSNVSRNVNWARFTSTLDGTQLQDFQFLELGGMPANPADVYSTANPASTFNPFVTWYQMGTTQLAEGQHQICLTGYDFNDTASRVSLGPVCRSFMGRAPYFLVGAQLRAVSRFASLCGQSFSARAGVPVARLIEPLPSMRRAGLTPRSRCAGCGSYSFEREALKPTVSQTVIRFAKPLYCGEARKVMRLARFPRASRVRTRTGNLALNSGALSRAGTPEYGVPEGTRTRDLPGHIMNPRSRREITRWLVGWMEREGFGSAEVRRQYLEAVELLPEGSLSLAVRKGVLFEKAARGGRQRRAIEGEGLNG